MNCQLIVLPILDDSFQVCVSCDCLHKLMHLHKINLVCVFSELECSCVICPPKLIERFVGISSSQALFNRLWAQERLTFGHRDIRRE